MAETLSNMTPLGGVMPGFDLPDYNGEPFSSNSLQGKATLVVFMCNHCPFVKYVIDTLVVKAKEYEEKGIAVVGINSNDVQTHPADSPENMKVFAAERGISFPYLLDETQAVAQAFQAACTPDFFLFDADHKLVYRGQFDDSRPSNDRPIDGADLTAAVNAIAEGKTVPDTQKPSIGCNIKWKEGNEPGLRRL